MQHNKIESSLNESSDKLTTYMSLAGGWGVSRRVRPPAPDPLRRLAPEVLALSSTCADSFVVFQIKSSSFYINQYYVS